MSKINYMKKVIEDLNVFRTNFRVRQEVNDEIQTSISFIKAELQAFNENDISFNRGKEKSFWLNGYGPKQILAMNPMGKKSQK